MGEMASQEEREEQAAGEGTGGLHSVESADRRMDARDRGPGGRGKEKPDRQPARAEAKADDEH